MVGRESFGPIAPHYDRLMSGVPYEMWVSYYELLLTKHDSTPLSLLDVCCGTGTVADLLVEKGFSVTGFDLSPNMIGQAKKREREGLSFFVADAAELAIEKSFEGAYSFFDSLNYITDPERLAAAIGKVSEHVEPGSLFVFDVNTAYAFEKAMFDQTDMRKRNRLKYKWKGEYDSGTRLIEVRMDFWYEDSHFVETHVQRAYSDDELRAMLDAAGFDVAASYESYSLSPPRKTSDRVHYVALRRPS